MVLTQGGNDRQLSPIEIDSSPWLNADEAIRAKLQADRQADSAQHQQALPTNQLYAVQYQEGSRVNTVYATQAQIQAGFITIPGHEHIHPLTGAAYEAARAATTPQEQAYVSQASRQAYEYKMDTIAAQLHARREALMSGFAGTFKTEYSQRMAAAAPGTFIPSHQEYAQVKYLASPTAQWASAETFQAKAAQVEKYAPFAGVTEFRGRIVQQAPQLTAFASQQQTKAGFNLPLLSQAEKPFFTPKERTAGTFNVLEGRTMQTYQWTKEASFGKSLFGKPQGSPEIGATYRKSWFGEYFKVTEPQAKITTRAGFEAVKTADILAPMFTTSGVFTSTAALKGASLGINIIPKIKSLIPSKATVSTSGFAGRMSEYTKVPTFEPRTYKTWLKEPSRYSSESPVSFYRRAITGEFRITDEPRGLFSREPPLETRTSLQLIDKRQLGFRGTGGFEITPRETKPAPLGKMMGEYAPSSPYTGKGRQSQALIQLPAAQKTITEQVKPAFVLKTEQVLSRSKLESMGAYRSSTAFRSMAMPRTNIFSGLKPSKTALMLSDITYETYKYPPGKRVRQGVHTLYKPVQAMQLAPITALKPAQMLSYTPMTGTATGTSLKTSQRTAQITSMNMKTMLRNAQATQQHMRSPPRPRTEILIPRLPPFRLSSSMFTGTKKGKKSKFGFGKFGEISRIASTRQILGFGSFGPAKPRRKGK